MIVRTGLIFGRPQSTHRASPRGSLLGLSPTDSSPSRGVFPLLVARYPCTSRCICIISWKGDSVIDAVEVVDAERRLYSCSQSSLPANISILRTLPSSFSSVTFIIGARAEGKWRLSRPTTHIRPHTAIATHCEAEMATEAPIDMYTMLYDLYILVCWLGCPVSLH